MILLFLIFVTFLVIVFGILMFFTRPTVDQSTTERRVAAILSAHVKRRTNAGVMQQELKGEVSATWERFPLGAQMIDRLQKLLLQAESTRSVASVVMTMLALGMAALLALYLMTDMFLLALAAALAMACIPIGVLRYAREKRIAAFNAALPDCLELCARALRAGHSIVAAVEIVAQEAVEPAKTEFGEVFKKQNYGLTLRDALMQMLERVPSADLQVFVTGVLVQKDTGGNLAEILDRIVGVIRERLRIEGEIRVHTAQGRLTGWILCLMPVVLLVLINVINPGYSSVLFHDAAGRRLLYIGIGLLLMGGFLIRQIINGIEV